MAHIVGALAAGKQGLGFGRYDTFQGARVQRDLGRLAQPGGGPFGLIEFAFSCLQWMERDRNDDVPSFGLQSWRGLADKQIGKKRLEPEGALIFVSVNDVQREAASRHGRARPTKMQF